jgi:hypothetical protein
MANICPVCGYSLERPPSDYRICPSCGTEFGYDDAGRDYTELRAAWLRAGARWWSPSRPAPVGWDPYKQLNVLFEKEPVISPALRDMIAGVGRNTASPWPGNVVEKLPSGTLSSRGTLEAAAA